MAEPSTLGCTAAVGSCPPFFGCFVLSLMSHPVMRPLKELFLESQYKLEGGPSPTMLSVKLFLLVAPGISVIPVLFFNGTLNFPCAKVFYS